MTWHDFILIVEDLDVEIEVLEVEEGVEAARNKPEIVVQGFLVNYISGYVVLDGLED